MCSLSANTFVYRSGFYAFLVFFFLLPLLNTQGTEQSGNDRKKTQAVSSTHCRAETITQLAMGVADAMSGPHNDLQEKGKGEEERERGREGCYIKELNIRSKENEEASSV